MSQLDVSDDPSDSASSVFSPPIDFHEANFISLPQQSNIYGLVDLNLGGSSKLLVATVTCVRGELFCLEFKKGSLRPSLTPITFTYIPGDAEVVSVDSFVREPNGVIIGVTLVKTDSDPKEMYFNLYGIHCNRTAPFQWEKIAEDWQALSLKFTPFQLTHTSILVGDDWDTVFLLSGDDLKVHLYREVWNLSELQFQEEPLELWFPELQDLPSSVTYMDIKLAGAQRLTALGCQNGFLKCALVDLCSGSILNSWDSTTLDGPITSVKLFSIVSEAAKAELSTAGDTGLTDLHMLVASAVELGVVFQNLLDEGFSSPCILPSSHLHDSVLCTQVADVNWDGKNELVLGTYGKEVLIYQLSKDRKDKTLSFDLAWKRSFSHPLHCLWYGDLSHDGLSELVAISMAGAHVLQHNLQDAVAVCINRLLPKAKQTDASVSRKEGDIDEEMKSGVVT